MLNITFVSDIHNIHERYHNDIPQYDRIEVRKFSNIATCVYNVVFQDCNLFVILGIYHTRFRVIYIIVTQNCDIIPGKIEMKILSFAQLISGDTQLTDNQTPFQILILS